MQWSADLGSPPAVAPIADDKGNHYTLTQDGKISVLSPEGKRLNSWDTGIKPDIEVKQPELTSGKKRETDFPHMLREKDLERHLGNETVKPEKTEEPAKDGEAAPKEPKINETPENTVAPEPVERSEDDDYQLQRAKDLLKGLTILKGMPAAQHK